MKKLSIILLALALVLSAGVAVSEPIVSKSVSSAASTVGYVVAPASNGMQPLLTYASVVDANATTGNGDFTLYQGANTKTLYAHTTAKAAGATTFDVTECGGFDDDDVVVIQWQGGTIEADLMSACSDTTDQMTITSGLVNAITSTQAGLNRIQIFEMAATAFGVVDIGTSRLQWSGDPIWAGTSSFPLVGMADTTEIINIEAFTVKYR